MEVDDQYGFLVEALTVWGRAFDKLFHKVMRESIGMLCNNLFEVLLYEGIIIIGLGTRMIMGFSPTIWASSDRTYLFFWFALIVDTVLIADSKRNLIDGICILNKKYEKYRNDIMYFLIVCAAVSNGLDVFYYRGVY